MFVCEREKETVSACKCVFVCVREREKEGVRVCEREGEKECVFVWVCVREKLFHQSQHSPVW